LEFAGEQNYRKTEANLERDRFGGSKKMLQNKEADYEVGVQVKWGCSKNAPRFKQDEDIYIYYCCCYHHHHHHNNKNYYYYYYYYYY
jgi:hypothetical protein